ncbi:hypothetical protein HRbin21_01536 [bacterium HR21]|jgi:uncharacterized membrane protein|nr:hypothetical protein HRbin21_01536 [bacterium HR21]
MRTSWEKLSGILLAGGLLLWLLGTSACQKSDQITAPDQTLVPEIPHVEALASTVSGGTLEEDLALLTPPSDRRRAPIHVWRCLNLDSAQRVAVLACLRTYHDSVRAVLKTLRDSERQYWQEARQMRRAVMDSLRQGLLDRQTAAQRLREIAQWLREQLQNNPVRQWAAEQLQQLKDALCACVSAVLTGEQQQIWQCWCSGGTNCCPTGSGDDHGGRGDDGKGDDHHGPRGPRP